MNTDDQNITKSYFRDEASLAFFFRSFLPYFFLFGEGSVVFFVKETQTREWNILSSIRLCNAIDTVT